MVGEHQRIMLVLQQRHQALQRRKKQRRSSGCRFDDASRAFAAGQDVGERMARHPTGRPTRGSAPGWRQDLPLSGDKEHG